MKKLICVAIAGVAISANAATEVPVQLLNPTGSTSGQAIVSTGASSAPAWGTVTAGTLAPQSANTVVANATASTASPTPVAIPSCSTTASALNYTTSSGFSCNATVNAATLNGATFASPGTIGGTTPGSATFTTMNSINTLTSGVSNIFSSTSNAATGYAMKLAGNGASAPTKLIQVMNGNFNIVNDAENAVISSLTDSGNLSVTGSITPAYPAGVVGNATGNSVSAGSVGQFMSSSIAVGGSVSLTTGTAANITSITLTAGDWDVWGTVCTNPAASTVQQIIIGSVSGTSGTLATAPNGGAYTLLLLGTTAGLGVCAPVGMKTVNVSTSTTEYLVIQSNFTVSTNGGYGFIGARRRS